MPKYGRIVSFLVISLGLLISYLENIILFFDNHPNLFIFLMSLVAGVFIATYGSVVFMYLLRYLEKRDNLIKSFRGEKIQSTTDYLTLVKNFSENKIIDDSYYDEWHDSISKSIIQFIFFCNEFEFNQTKQKLEDIQKKLSSERENKNPIHKYKIMGKLQKSSINIRPSIRESIKLFTLSPIRRKKMKPLRII